MKLLELTLHAYGAFKDRTLDFSHAGPALHLIYGPNEAGKSTTLRALIALLYGIEHQSPDANLLGGPNLRIGARLCDERGQELVLTRRKGVKNTLLGANGEPLDEAVLTRALGGIPQAVFSSMFGLDHERLRQGGEQLGRGRGDLGESLFQAGMGTPGIHDALRSLSKEADELFLPRGKRLLNQAIKQYEDARRQVREHAKRADGFRAQEQELERERTRSAALSVRRHALLAEQSRLQRALRVMPALARLRVLRDKRAGLGDVVALPAGAADARRTAHAQLAASETQCMQLRKMIAGAEQRIAELVVPESLASLSPEFVRRIRNRLGGHLKAAEDLPNRRAELRALELEAAAALRALGRPVALAEVESLRVDSATFARVHKLAALRSGLCEKADAAARDLAAADAAVAAARAELAALSDTPSQPAPAGFGDTAPALRGGAGFSDTAPALRGGAIVALRLPSDAIVIEYRQRFDRIEQERARQRDAANALAERDARARRALDVLEREGAPPTEQDLKEARAERDAVWRGLKTALENRTQVPEPSADRYEALQQRSDELSDRLRREARRVSELASLLAERDSITRERAHLAERSAELLNESAALAQEWQALWRPLGVQPRAPLEMQALLGKVRALLESGEHGRAQAERRGREARDARSAFESDWAELMVRLHLPGTAAVEEAQAVLEELRRLFEKSDAIAQLRTRIDAIEQDARQFESDVRALVERHLPAELALPLEQAAEELNARHGQALRNRELRAELARELHDARAQLAVQADAAVRAGHELDALMRAAHVADLDALEAAERGSEQAGQLARDLVEVENDLLAHGEGADIAALIAETAELHPDQLRARLEDIKEELDAVADEHAQSAHDIGSLDAGLDRLRRSDAAAEAAAEAEQHLSRVQALARAYAQRKLAAELLARQIRSYRDQNQGPILSRAAELFARLTLGRYPRLDVGYQADDEPALLCVDARGAQVELSALSDGTRDQLYLALRLSSLARFAQQDAPMPLVLDDVLIHFDDDRARAALSVLGEFAQTTQVLFFTHHARLCELARSAVPAGLLVEHRLVDDRAAFAGPADSGAAPALRGGATWPRSS